MKLAEVYNEFASEFGKGFFNVLVQAEVEPMWEEDEETEGIISTYMDGMLFGKYGQREISPFLAQNLVNGHFPSDLARGSFSFLVYKTNQKRWKHLWDILSLSYNPIENYSMTEKETPAETTLTSSPAEQTISSDGTTSAYGYNSTTASPTNETETETKNEVDAAGTDVFTVQNDRELTRSGNIGVTTSQQMIESEIDLWTKYNFYEIVVKDVSDMLTLKVYS